MSDLSPKVLVIGLDGATFDLMLPWVEEGYLPHLADLLRTGAHSRLESTTPPITPCAWSSFMTGKNPGKHGLFDFVEPIPESRNFRFTNASSRKAESLWKLLSRHGRRVGVVNVPMTYPPESVHGYLLSGLDTPHEKSRYSYPERLREELADHGISYRVDLRHLGDMCTDRRRYRRLVDMREMESIRTDAVCYLQKKYPADFRMVVYIAIDQVQHHFWQYMDPSHDKYDAQGARKFSTAIRDMYGHIDKLIGRLMERVDDNTVVIVMSDHGFGPTRNTRLRINQVLARQKLLSFSTESLSRRKGRFLAGLLDRALRTTLSPTVKGRLAALFPRLRLWLEGADEAPIDWSQTLAFTNEAYRASPAIWLNRMVNGRLIGTDEQHTLQQVEQALLKLIDPETGEPVVGKVYRTRDLYQGPYVDHAPDLLPSWWEDGFLLEQSQPEAAPKTDVEHSETPVRGGVEFAGSHRLDGVLILQGGPTRQGHKFADAQIIDIAPTVLYLMGLPIPSDMDGCVLTEAIDPQYLADHPIDRQEVLADVAGNNGQDNSMSKEEEQLLARRLRALGYIE